MHTKGEKIAIIDLGSNSVRLIIFKLLEDNSYKLIEQEKEMVRLGERLGTDGMLKEGPMERTILTLKLFRDLIRAHGVSKTIMTATAAVRSARNRDAFLERIEEEFGFTFEVISGEREAYLGYLGVVNTVQLEDFYLMDIGGASTEISYVRNRRVEQVYSFDFGAVSLADRFPEGDKGAAALMGTLEHYIRQELKKAPWFSAGRNIPLIGLGGTMRSFAKIVRRNTFYPLEKLHNFSVGPEAAMRTISMVAGKELRERGKIRGLDKSRVDIILHGLTILRTAMQVCQPSEIIISGNGLREGLFYEYLLRDKKRPVLKNVRKESVRNLLGNYDVNVEHCKHIRHLARQLFKGTQAIHQVPDEARYLLDYAALLHDVGIYIDYYAHHKHAYYLITNANLNGFTHRELFMIGNIAAKHRNKSFKIDFSRHKMLISRADLHLVELFSLFLRIGENLDRGEEENIRDLKIIVSGDVVLVKAETNNGNGADLEIAAAMKSGEEFRALLGKSLLITTS